MARIDNVPVIVEGKRGCGYRKPGGLYLMSNGLSAPCGRLPIALDICPVCSSGIKQTRGWTWIDPAPLLSKQPCRFTTGSRKSAWAKDCSACPLRLIDDNVLAIQAAGDEARRHGLIWIGESFYPTPNDWMRETAMMGASRRVKCIPRDFVLGKTWVFVAHAKTLDHACDCVADEPQADPLCEECEGSGTVRGPGIFHVFLPEEIQYVCHGDETDRELDDLEQRGIRPVRVTRADSGEDSEDND